MARSQKVSPLYTVEELRVVLHGLRDFYLTKNRPPMSFEELSETCGGLTATLVMGRCRVLRDELELVTWNYGPSHHSPYIRLTPSGQELVGISVEARSLSWLLKG